MLKKEFVVDPNDDATVLACRKSFLTTNALSPIKLLDVTLPLIPDPEEYGDES